MTPHTIQPTLAAVVAALSLLLGGCHSPASDPAPPPANYEIATAPPGARGARAAGTDAAPPRPSEGVLDEPGEDDEDEAEPEADAGSENDAGATPDAGAGVAL